MKKTIFAAAMLAATSIVSAAPSLSWEELSTGTLNADFDNIAGVTYTSPTISLGTLTASESATVTYTFLGSEAGFQNIFFAPVSTKVWNINWTGSPTVGDTYSTWTGAGAVNFKFVGQSPDGAINGGDWTGGASIGLIGTRSQGYSYDFVLGYNDSFNNKGYTHDDWDDMVIGVNIAPIPEPETYAMLLAGLGLMGFVARRRKQRTA